MNIINPNEIGSKISTVILESKKRFCAVTPYLGISEWKKILTNLKRAKENDVEIEFYVREIKDEDLKVLHGLGAKVFMVEGLHTKMFFNETTFIVTSMNLYEYSDLHSIDFGIQYNDSNEYSNLFEYFTEYIYPFRLNQSSATQNIDEQEIEKIFLYIKNKYYEAKVTRSSTYVFSKNLVPYFDVFIYVGHLTFKRAYIPTNEIQFQSIVTQLNNLRNVRIELDEPDKDTKHPKYYWRVFPKDYSLNTITNIIGQVKLFRIP